MIPTMRQLEALVQVYRHGSLTKAAAELRVTLIGRQPPDPADRGNFQLRLFDRTTRVYPTFPPAGTPYRSRNEYWPAPTDWPDTCGTWFR